MLYLVDGLWQGHAATCLGRNQLLPSSISLSLLGAGHANDLQINTACGPPRSFRHASTCPRLDRWVSGSISVTPRACTRRTSPLWGLRACCFRFGSPHSLGLAFATGIHSLARSSKRRMQHWHHSSYCSLATASFTVEVLWCCIALSPFSFRNFSPPFLGRFSAFPHGTIALSVSRRI